MSIVAGARSNALLLNTPDPLRLDPMRTMGSMRRRHSTSSEGSQQRLVCSERDPLNQDTVQYAASPLRRMQTLAEAGGPGGTSPVQAAPMGRTRRRRSHASVTADAARNTAAGCDCRTAAEEIATAAAVAEQGMGREQAEETPCVIKAGFDRSRAKMKATTEKTVQGICRKKSRSTQKNPAGKARSGSRSTRMQAESNADLSSVVLSESSSSLDMYQMLKARSRRAHRKRHSELTELSSLSGPSSAWAHSMPLGDHVPCRHFSTPRLLRPDSLWTQKQHHAPLADPSGIGCGSTSLMSQHAWQHDVKKHMSGRSLIYVESCCTVAEMILTNQSVVGNWVTGWWMLIGDGVIIGLAGLPPHSGSPSGVATSARTLTGRAN